MFCRLLPSLWLLHHMRMEWIKVCGVCSVLQAHGEGVVHGWQQVAYNVPLKTKCFRGGCAAEFRVSTRQCPPRSLDSDPLFPPSPGAFASSSRFPPAFSFLFPPLFINPPATHLHSSPPLPHSSTPSPPLFPPPVRCLNNAWELRVFSEV